MNAKKRKLRVRHGEDQIANKVLALRLQFLILAAERYDSQLPLLPGQCAHSIAMEASAVHNVIRFVFPGSCPRNPLGLFLLEMRDPRLRDDAPATCGDATYQGRTSSRVIDDTFFRKADARDT